MKHEKNSNQPDFAVGNLVRIAPQFCEGGEAKRIYVVVTPPEGKGRVDISPADWTEAQGMIRPQEVILCSMLIPA